MTAYLLDTNHASPLVTIGHPLRNLILRQRQLGDTFILPAPVLHEFLFGIASTARSHANLREWENLKAGLLYLATDEFDAERSFQLRFSLRRQGWQIGLVDAFVAALALRYDLTLLTTDKDFAAVPGLKRDNWLK